MNRAHPEIERLVASVAGKHDMLAVGSFADGEAAFRGPEANEPPLFEIGSISKPLLDHGCQRHFSRDA